MDFDAIPEEILDMIIGYTIEDAKNLNQMRQLRVVCKRFSASHTLLSALFHNMQIIGSVEDFTSLRLKHVLASGLAPYARHITFYPPLYAPFGYEEFEAVFQSQSDWEYGCYDENAETRVGRLGIRDPIPSRANIAALAPRRSRRLCERRERGQLYLQTEKQLEEGFKEYFDIAIDESGALVLQCPAQLKDWVDILKYFNRCTSFRFGLVDYNYIGPDMQPMRPE